jgi:RNA polymerase sigma factor (sigma-70 family)
MGRFLTGQEEALDVAAGLATYDPNESPQKEVRESIDAMLSQLSARERTILTDHYGLDDEGKGATLEQLGQKLGISKERVRQIEINALKKLRGLATEEVEATV